MIEKPLLLSEDFQEALDLLENSSEHIFLTGRAGTGKSTLLNIFRKTTRKKVVVLAPTGVAALNVGGQTIHSFFGFAPRMLNPEDIKVKKSKKIFRVLDIIVIDEISMVRADLLDNIDYSLRLHRNNNEPFGGVQMIFIGDLFQLPPVVSSQYERNYFQTVYETPYFFSAHVLSDKFSLETIVLSKAYRQTEGRFLNMLDAIRSGDIDEELLQELNERNEEQEMLEQTYITLTARNAVAQNINQTKLDELDAPVFTYLAKISGQFNPTLYPTDAALKLRIGAQVMMIKNDPGKKYVNGSLGVVEQIDESTIRIRIQKDQKSELVEVTKQEWEVLKYTSKGKNLEIQTEVVGSFIQYPIKLAWAITIHKSQGKTFDHVLIDLKGGAFEHGQTYVALSRCRTFTGIRLARPVSYRDILVDQRIVDFYQQIR